MSYFSPLQITWAAARVGASYASASWILNKETKLKK
jgi:hypothetical protein